MLIVKNALLTPLDGTHGPCRPIANMRPIRPIRRHARRPLISQVDCRYVAASQCAASVTALPSQLLQRGVFGDGVREHPIEPGVLLF
jgi:hypothetical protein